MQPASLLRELTWHMRSHSVPGRGDIPTFTPAKLVLDLVTPVGCKAELNWWLVRSLPVKRQSPITTSTVFDEEQLH